MSTPPHPTNPPPIPPRQLDLTILGAGSWGTTLALTLAPACRRLRLWVHNHTLADRLTHTRRNDTYLPDCPLPAQVEIITDLPAAVTAADLILGAMPSQHARGIYTALRPHAPPDALFVSATKGLETTTLLRMTEVMAATLGPVRLAALSGPSFAREVAHGQPAAVVAAAAEPATATAVQAALSRPALRVYTNTDLIGTEVGGALKNVIALAAGVCHGLGLGSNTVAALVTRGLAEITRLAVALGAQPRTLSGLAGLGDLVLTCTGDLSRNRRAGIALGQGRSLADVTASTPMVAEGVPTAYAAAALARRAHVDVPIIDQTLAILREAKPPRQAIQDLMDRPLREE